MKKNAFLWLVLVLATASSFAQSSLVFRWNFDQPDASMLILGKGTTVPGVKGLAYQFDGFTSAIDALAGTEIKMPEAFTISAWVAMGAYPWNWAPILTLGRYEITGFYFGMDSKGCLGFYMADASGEWRGCRSPLNEKTGLGMDLNRWYQITATYEPKKGIAIYIDGALQGACSDFYMTYGVRYSNVDKDMGFRIGMNRQDLAPTDAGREWATWPSRYSFDGIMDEIMVYDRALSEVELASLFAAVKPENDPVLPLREFPKIKNSGRFGANYTRLEYYPAWDNLWPPGDHMDVAVQFDELPIKVMFWRGSRYSPCWVSENNKWMADQSRETGYNWYLEEGDRNLLPTGCLEHMSDAQCRSSRVAIIENNDARVVVNWRYLQMDVQYRQKDLPDNSGFGEWGNELYYIYPDGVGIRYVYPGIGGFLEPIFFSAPGTRPEDNVEVEAVTLLNMDGESKTYSWETGIPRYDLRDANIHMVNFKSEFKPFLILQEGGGFMVFGSGMKPKYSVFPWWNHWPVAQIHSDGRNAYAPDRAAHSSLSWGSNYGNTLMYGMTNKPKEHLVTVARSWNFPAELISENNNFEVGEYDRKQRAYLVQRLSPQTGTSTLHRNDQETGSRADGETGKFKLLASEKSPLLNPVLVISNWGPEKLKLRIDGVEIPHGPEFRYATEYAVDGTPTTIVFIKLAAQSEKRIELHAVVN